MKSSFSLDIKYLKHHEIDKKQWDAAIEKATNRLVYALSWYLDIISPKWDALVLDDYKAVMPLTWRKKFGIRYLYKPFFSQFLGVYYAKEEYSSYVKDFLEHASKYFRLINININPSSSNFEADYTTLRKTQVMDLSENYSRNFYCKIDKQFSTCLFYSNMCLW